MIDDSVRITLRLPAALHTQVAALAQQDERSLNKQIVRLLQEAERNRAKCLTHDFRI
jgi:hypothetical protein